VWGRLIVRRTPSLSSAPRATAQALLACSRCDSAVCFPPLAAAAHAPYNPSTMKSFTATLTVLAVALLAGAQARLHAKSHNKVKAPPLHASPSPLTLPSSAWLCLDLTGSRAPLWSGR
jgi:hypothetical protein